MPRPTSPARDSPWTTGTPRSDPTSRLRGGDADLQRLQLLRHGRVSLLERRRGARKARPLVVDADLPPFPGRDQDGVAHLDGRRAPGGVVEGRIIEGHGA